MQPKLIGLMIVTVVDVLLLIDVTTGQQIVESVALWMVLHGVSVVVGSVLIVQYLFQNSSEFKAQLNTDSASHSQHESIADGTGTLVSLVAFIAILGLSIPGMGMVGICLTMIYGLQASRNRTYTPDYWKVTPVAALPYVAPLDRQLRPVDSRGFTEHLLYSTDDQDVYQKVLASATVKTNLAIDTLKQAMQHKDERVRLTAYKTLDKKITSLNKQIQHLEKELDADKDKASSDRWLQIASNYWELVTLEGAEVVARKQLLSKAAAAAIKAVALLPSNRNAHLVLGRISLAQGDTRRATVALERAQSLGMPRDKVLPYLAECAFVEKNLPQVQRLLAGLDSSIVAYPPLSHVARYWA